jgi:hypothetical protein
MANQQCSEAFVELASPQAATALKHRIDSFGADKQYVKKHTSIYVRPDYNPFKTSPKDAPARAKVATPGAYNSTPSFPSGGFRGGRGGYNRGGGMNNMNTGVSVGGVNNRGGFNNSQMNMAGGFNGGAMAGNYNNNNNNNMMGGFNNGMGGFNNRGGGGMMAGNMRGTFQNNRGRGGMMPNMNMAMGGMGMGMMGMGMGNMGNMNNMAMGAMGGMGAMGIGNMNMGKSSQCNVLI